MTAPSQMDGDGAGPPTGVDQQGASDASPAESPLDGLDPRQRKAASHGAGPLLLLAGAGSGKTRVVTRRVAWLMENGVRPDRLLALTFSNRAAREMRERVESLLGPEKARLLTVSTFHALGARMLRQHADVFGRTSSYTIYDNDDQLRIIKLCLVELGLPTSGALPRAVRRGLDGAKNAGRSAEISDMPIELLAAGAADGGMSPGARLLNGYEALLRRSDAFDFGDLLMRPAELLEADEYVRSAYRRRWPWVLVDEFQDTNRAQYRWLRLLAPPGANLFVVGDDDQSIYGWRGAEVDNIIGFPDAYPGTKLIRLERNYRSTGHILNAANGVIGHNIHRLGKALWTSAGDGMQLERHDADDGRREGQWVARKIAALCTEEGYRPGDVAVFFRTNNLSLDVEEALRVEGVPYAVIRGRSFYDRAEVKQALAYVRLLVNPDDDVAFRTAVNVPPRGIGKQTLARLTTLAGTLDVSSSRAVATALSQGQVSGRARSGLSAFAELLSETRQRSDLRPSGQVRHVLDRAGFLDYLSRQDAGERDTAAGESHASDRLPNIDRLLVAIEAYEESGEPNSPTLRGYLERVQLVSELDMCETDGGAVSLMTIHAAKGLEFPVVFAVGLEEGIFPHARSQSNLDRGVEEERRLCYVAFTRARQRLFLSCARSRRTFGQVRKNRPSRFLTELPPNVLAPSYEPIPDGLEQEGLRRSPTIRGRSRDRVHRVGLRRVADSQEERDPHGGDSSQGFGHEVDADFRWGDEPNYRVGMMVWHADFGAGKIVAVGRGRSQSLTIDFPDIGQRRIVARFVSPYDA